MQFTIRKRARRAPWRVRRRAWHRHFAILPVLFAKDRGHRTYRWLTTIERRWSQTHSRWLYRAIETHSQGESQ